MNTELEDMGKNWGFRFGFAGSVLLLLSGLIVLLNCAQICNGGVTSNYVRSFDYSRDMPLDSDVFRVPPGYNAPQQVSVPFLLRFLSKLALVKILCLCNYDDGFFIPAIGSEKFWVKN